MKTPITSLLPKPNPLAYTSHWKGDNSTAIATPSKQRTASTSFMDKPAAHASVTLSHDSGAKRLAKLLPEGAASLAIPQPVPTATQQKLCGAFHLSFNTRQFWQKPHHG